MATVRVSEEEAIQRGWIKAPPPEPAPAPATMLRGRYGRGPAVTLAFTYVLCFILGWLVGFVFGLAF